MLKPLDGIGILAPENQYRRPCLVGEALRKEIRETDGAAVIEEARAALSAGLPGTTLVLAKALWTQGEKYRPIAVALSADAYGALGRPLLAGVVENHRATWREGSITFADRKD